MIKKRNLFFLSLLVQFSLFAQEENIGAISTDRPNATYAASMMNYKYLQVESGGIYQELEGNGYVEDAITYNTSVIRYGLLTNLEVQASWSYQENNYHHRDLTSKNGFSALHLATKVGVTEQMGWVPKMTLFSQLSFPFAVSKDYQNETTGIEVRMLMNNDLSKRSSLSYNLGVNKLNDASEISYVYTLSYGYSITQKIGLFAEVYANIPEDHTAEHFWDIGGTYLLSNNFQADLLFGTGFDNAQNYQIAAGLSYRFSKNPSKASEVK